MTGITAVKAIDEIRNIINEFPLNDGAKIRKINMVLEEVAA